MDLYAGAALTGLGYMLNQQRNPPKAPPPAAGDVPSMKNIYSSDYWQAVKADEFARGTERFEASMDPLATGVVPKPAYASMFQPLTAAPGAGAGAGAAPGAGTVQTLSGETMRVEQFTHNNMQPYFRGRVTQSLDPFATSPMLESHTGNYNLMQPKQEVACFFEPTAGFTNVCGMDNQSDYYQKRIEPPRARNNDFPLEQVRVGPGLGQGFTAGASGGYQQENTLDYARPKTVDELRVASKPKVSFQIPVQGPQKGIDKRALLGEVAKNRVDTYYEQSADQWLRTTGATLREQDRPFVDLKPTARVEGHVEYEGHAVATQQGRADQDDYGRANVVVYDNERSTTQTRTVVGNLTSLVKAVVAPILDVFRRTPKEYTVDAPRTFGNMQAQIPDKPTTYDNVNHMMRTTIKETTIHDTTVMNPRGPDATTMRTDDDAKTTVRETVDAVDPVRNVGAKVYRVQVYNPEEAARTTMKETTEDAAGSMFGFIGGPVEKTEGAYAHVDVQVPATQKQFVSDHEHVGTAGAKAEFRARSQAAERNAEIDGTREAIEMASAYTPAAGGGYVGLAAEGVDVSSRRLMQDAMAPRDTANVTRVVQPTARAIDACEITKPHDLLNAQENRLDPSLLNALRYNEYNLAINPIGTA